MSHGKTIKTSISLPVEIWEKVKNRENRSNIVSIALTFYLDHEDSLKKAEESYWKKVIASVSGKNDDYVLLNPGAEEITKETLQKKLWK